MSFLPSPGTFELAADCHYGEPGPSQFEPTYNEQDDSWVTTGWYCVLPHPDTFEHQTKTEQGTGSDWPVFGQVGDPAPSARFSPGVEGPVMYGTHGRAHQPVPPELYSSYSTLDANVAFLKRLEQEDRRRRLATNQVARPSTPPALAPPPSSNIMTANPYAPAHPASSSFGVPSPSPPVFSPPYTPPYTFVNSNFIDIDPPEEPNAAQSTQSQETQSATGQSIRNSREPLHPKQACSFCRQRKIACRRADPDVSDQRCNQCAMRKFPAADCSFLTSKKPGRGKAKAKVMKG